MATTAHHDIYYDPYDFDIDADPYPMWKRMRDETPLYYNDQFDFYAVSRFADVEACSVNWQTYQSGRGTLLEMIRAGRAIPRGMFIFEDPPIHDLHRGFLSRVFTPRRGRGARGTRARDLCAIARSVYRLRRVRLRARPRCRDADAGDQPAARDPRSRPSISARSHRRQLRIDAGEGPEVADASNVLTNQTQFRRVHRFPPRAPLRRPDDRSRPSHLRRRAPGRTPSRRGRDHQLRRAARRRRATRRRPS